MNTAHEKLPWVIIASLLTALITGVGMFISMHQTLQEVQTSVVEMRDIVLPRYIDNFHEMIDTHGTRVSSVSGRVSRLENILMSGMTDGELAVDIEIENTDAESKTNPK